MDRGQGKVDRETGYEKDKVTRRVNRWTSRQVNKLLEMGDKVTEEQSTQGSYKALVLLSPAVQAYEALPRSSPSVRLASLLLLSAGQ